MALFETDQEHRYFKLFVDRIAGEICPYFDSEDWSRMILQACTGESSIRHVAGAIGALGKFYTIQHAGQSIAGLGKSESDCSSSPGSSSISEGQSGIQDLVGEQLIRESYIHQRQALILYDKALKKIREDIAIGNQTIRTALIVTIVVTCLEALSGRHKFAAGQVYTGLNLIQEWKAQQKQAEQHPQGFSSPARDVVDDFLVQTFGRMEIQAMSVFDPRPVEVHKMLKLEGKEVVERMPPVFNSIAQARIYLDLINRRLMHFNMSIHDRRTRPPASKPGPPSTLKPIGWSTTEGSSPEPIPLIDGKTFEHSPPTASILGEQTALNNELALWTATFRPLLTFSLAMGRQEAISALTLTISTIASQISLRAAFFTNELSFDVFMPEFKLIVEQATLLLETQRAHDLARHSASASASPSSSDFSSRLHSPSTSSGPLMRFAFEIGVIPPLYLVMIKCRNRRLRRRALHLLKEYPRREGVWDTVAVTHLGRWVIGLEEESARQMSMSLSPVTVIGESESPAASLNSASTPTSGSETSGRGIGGFSASNGARKSSGRQVIVTSSYDTAYDHASASIYSNGHSNGDPLPNGHVEVEPEANPGIDIPEEIRVRKTWMRFDLIERTAWLNCLQRDHITGEYIDRTDTVNW
ncbi:uncharacterized protein RSE6_07644 [Rhynchosporium secalis]|uniref:Uncharacterized protein n=1 Tax=Rhynchosporium secalis TaxID=38038 RepID=A0A1E1MEG5_RHYSE|nr:uncharacterized protein RSE6_07644 [Rhynchosporium secalis]